MIDFEAMAAARALSLSQDEQPWLDVARGEVLASASTSMSDGEIHQMFSCVGSPSALLAICEAFVQARDEGEGSAFRVWKDHFAKLEIGLLEAAELWQRNWPRHRRFTECLKSIHRPLVVGRASGSGTKKGG